MKLTYAPDRLNISFHPGQRTDLLQIDGVLSVEQLFPESEDATADWFIVDVDPAKLEPAYRTIRQLMEIMICEKLPLSTPT